MRVQRRTRIISLPVFFEISYQTGVSSAHFPNSEWIKLCDLELSNQSFSSSLENSAPVLLAHAAALPDLTGAVHAVHVTTCRYTEAEAAATIRAMLEALAYCHSLNVIHRDIK